MDSKSTLRTAEPATVRPAGAVKVAPPPQPGDRLPQSSLSTLGRYAAALVAVVAATLLRMVIDPLVGEHRVPFITYFLAVVAAAWFGGCGPAVLTIVLSTLAASYFFLGPSGSLAVSSASDLASLGVFIAVGAAISAISESQR